MSLTKKIYVLHKNGFPEHYLALKTLCDDNGIQLLFREFTIIKNILKSVISLDTIAFKKQVKNVVFLLELLFTRRKKVVLGIAPYDYKLILLRVLLQNHTVYYHSSWPVWDGTFYPKKKFDGRWLKNTWKSFLEKKVRHIFTVTQIGRNGILDNYEIPNEKISVVYHSYRPLDTNFEKKKNAKGKPTFLYVGRLVEKKGLLELLGFFEKNAKLTFSIVGDGPLRHTVEGFATKCSNINFLGFIGEKEKLMPIYVGHDYLLLNSKKTKGWEELFGMVLIEAMSCGTIPIATNHCGPMEIINHESDGFLVKEVEFVDFLTSIKDQFPSPVMHQKALDRGAFFTNTAIKQHWGTILKA